MAKEAGGVVVGSLEDLIGLDRWTTDDVIRVDVYDTFGGDWATYYCYTPNDVPTNQDIQYISDALDVELAGTDVSELEPQWELVEVARMERYVMARFKGTDRGGESLMVFFPKGE